MSWNPGSPHIPPQLHNVRLNQNFGDSPVGRLAGSAVQAARAGAPRVGAGAGGPQTAPPPALGLGSRFLNAVTPHGLRAESKVLAGLKATSEQVGDLLGALSKGPGQVVDGLAAKRLMDALPQTAAPVTSRGAAFSEVFSQRVGVHVKNMSTEQLVALRDGVEQAQPYFGAGDPQQARNIAVIQEAVQKELTGRLLEESGKKMVPILGKLVAELPREAGNPGTVAFAFNEVSGAAFTLLRAHGLSADKLGAAAFDSMKAVLIQQMLSDAVDNETISLADMKAILGHLSSKELQALSRPSDGIGGGTTTTIAALATSAIDQRAANAEAGFMKAADRLLARMTEVVDDPTGPLQNPQAFAKDLMAASQHLAQLRAHAATTGVKFPPAVQARHEQLQAHLEKLCQPQNLLVEELSHSQLHGFSQALKGLGIAAGGEHVAAELAKRKEAASAGFGAALRGVCVAVQSGNPQALLASLQAFSGASSATVQALQRLGAPVDGADQVMAFRAEQTTLALNAMSTEQLGALFAALGSPDVQSLQGGLGELGQGLLEQGEPGGRPLYDASLDLQSLSSLVKDVLVTRGVHLPEMPDEASYGLATLKAPGLEAIRQAFDAQLGPDGQATLLTGVGSPRFQKTADAMGKALDDVAAMVPGANPEAVKKSLEDFVNAPAFKALPPATREAILTKIADKFAYLDVAPADALRLADPTEMRHTLQLIAFESMSQAQVMAQLKSMDSTDLLGLVDHAFAKDTPYGQQREGGWVLATALKQMLAAHREGAPAFDHIRVADGPALRALVGGLESGRYDPAVLRTERARGSDPTAVMGAMETQAVEHGKAFAAAFGVKSGQVVEQLDVRLAELEATGKSGTPIARELAALRAELVALRDPLPGPEAFEAFTRVFGFRFENTTAFSELSPRHNEPDIALRRLGEAFTQAGAQLRAATNPDTRAELAALDRMVMALPTAEKSLSAMSYLPSLVEDLSASLERLSARDGRPHSLKDYPVLVFDQSGPGKLAENRAYVEALNARTGANVMVITMAEASALGEKLGLRELFVTSQDGRAGFGGARNMSFLLAPMLHKALRDPESGVRSMADLIAKPQDYLEGLMKQVLNGTGHEMVLMGDDDTTVQPGFVQAKMQLAARYEDDYAKVTTLTLGRATTQIPPVVHPSTLQAIGHHEDAMVAGVVQIPLSITGAMRATQWEGDPKKAVEHQMAGALMHPGSCLDLPLPSEEGQFANYKHEVVDWLGTALHHPGDRFDRPDARLERLASYYNQAQIAIDLLGVIDKPHSDVLPWNDRSRSFDNIGGIYAHASSPETQAGIRSGFMARLVDMPVNQELLDAQKAFEAMEAQDRAQLDADPVLAEQAAQVKAAFLKASSAYKVAIAYREALLGNLVDAFRGLPPSPEKALIEARLSASPGDAGARKAALDHLARHGGPGLDAALSGAIAKASRETPGFDGSDIAKSMDVVATSTLVRFGALSTRLAAIQA